MLKLLNNPEERTYWVEWNGARFCIRPLTRRQIFKLTKQASKTKWVRGRRIEEVDDEALDDLIRRHIMVNWKGVVDENGNEIPFSDEAAKQLTDQYPALSNYLFEKATDIAALEAEREEEEKENLSSTPGSEPREA